MTQRGANKMVAIALLGLAGWHLLPGFYLDWGATLDLNLAGNTYYLIPLSGIRYALVFLLLGFSGLYLLNQTRLASPHLSWLHLIGTTAALIMFWKVQTGLLELSTALSSLRDTSAEGGRAVIAQRILLLKDQRWGAITLFVLSQSLLIINLFLHSSDKHALKENELLDRW